MTLQTPDRIKNVKDGLSLDHSSAMQSTLIIDWSHQIELSLLDLSKNTNIYSCFVKKGKKCFKKVIFDNFYCIVKTNWPNKSNCQKKEKGWLQELKIIKSKEKIVFPSNLELFCRLLRKSRKDSCYCYVPQYFHILLILLLGHKNGIEKIDKYIAKSFINIFNFDERSMK